MAELARDVDHVPALVQQQRGERVAQVVRPTRAQPGHLEQLAETTLRSGLMAFLAASWSDCTALIAGESDRAAVAVELGRQLTVISGEQQAIRDILERASARGIAGGPLPLAQAYHSPDVASLGAGFIERLSGLRSRRATMFPSSFPARSPSHCPTGTSVMSGPLWT